MAGKGSLAKQIRTGLTGPKLVLVQGKSLVNSDPLDECFHGKSKREHVKDFGALIGVILFSIAIYYLYRYDTQYLLTVSILVVVGVGLSTTGYRAPRLLFPLWRAWMFFAKQLERITVVPIMFVMWLVGMLPTALVVKIFSIKTMDLSYDSQAKTYWQDRSDEDNRFSLLKRQF